MLKVSLLPESYRRKIVGSKKKEQVKKVSLVVLVMLFAFFVVVIGTRQYVLGKYNKIQSMNAEAVAMFPQLQEYQALYNEIEAQKKLIDTVSAKEPYAHNFVVSLGNIESPGLWLTAVSANDWFYTKQCSVEGSCLSYSVYQDYIKKIEKIEGVASVATTEFLYTDEITETGDRICTFKLIVTCTGTGTVYVAPTEPPQSTAEVSTTK